MGWSADGRGNRRDRRDNVPHRDRRRGIDRSERDERMVDRRAAHDGGNRRPAHLTLPWGREDVRHTNVDVVRRGR